MKIAGVFAALTTPFAPDGGVSLADFKTNLRRYDKTGLAGYLVAGSTGESALLSDAEWESVLAAAIEVAAPGKILFAGTGVESTAETIAKTKRAAALGYPAAIVKTPHFYKPSYKPDVLIAHYRRVADASPIPIFLYSVPQLTGVTLEAPEVAALASHPNIIGIKDSSGHVQRIVEMVAAVPSDFHVVVGSASTLYPSLAVGARGGVLALADVLPEKCVELYDLVSQNRHEEARKLQLLLQHAWKTCLAFGSIGTVKYAMDFAGYHGGIPRLPLPELGEAQKEIARQAFAPLMAGTPIQTAGAARS
jgi:dihydrodipicolinate synthase/N-acetylneuraminate lyase